MLRDKILKTIKKYNLINSGDKIVVGVSGGPDSICLLHLLNLLKNELNFEIVVAHINHMIRKEADEETEFVKEFCKNIGIECYVNKTDILKLSAENKMGTEETGRNVRYTFFEEVRQKTGANKIATAHNANDKIETVLLNILRGSGTAGLKGIEPIRNKKLIRPLIEIERKEIEQYCKENSLNPRYDKTNNESIYKRNKIRNELIPYLQKEFNPNIIKTIGRLSELASQEYEYIQEIIISEYKNICIFEKDKEIVIDLKKFNKLKLIEKRRIILYIINKVANSTSGIEKVNIEDIIKLCEKNVGNKYLVPTKGLKIYVKKSKVYYINLKTNI